MFWIGPVVIAFIGACKQPLWEVADRGAPIERTPEAVTMGLDEPPPNPKELGWVRWERDFEAAARAARTSGKPLFLLFQEVPGCSTCVGFGESVLSHPLVIEAIETEFVPVAIYNNVGGADREVLTRFHEPPWNNPVVRFVDAEGRDLVPRADGVWSTHGIAQRMTQALVASGHAVPDYLEWAVAETNDFERATFSMGCYWSGEACLGDIPGVVATRVGWREGREVVVVDYDESQLDESSLKEQASRRRCGDYVAGSVRVRDASDSDRKYHLQRSRWRYLPLTPLQAARVNAQLARGSSPDPWLSPRQRSLATEVAGAEEATLAGLVAPADVGQLPRYERVLRARLRQP